MASISIITNAFLFFALYIQILLLFTFIEKKSNINGKIDQLKGKAGSQENPSAFDHSLCATAKTKGDTRYERENNPISSYQPSVTILVPVYNEELTIKGTIESLLNLHYPKDKLQIVVINDGSVDNTLDIANQFKSNPLIKIISKENGGKHTALNKGIAMTKSDLVGCLDADSFVEPDALTEIVRVFQNKNIMAVTPAIRIHNPQNILQKIQQLEYNIGIFFRKTLGEMNALYVTPGPFSIFRRSVFEKIGTYRKAHNTEDMEIALRMHKNHLPIANTHKAYVNTTAPKTIKALYKQRLRWAYGFLKNAIDYKELIFNAKYGNVGMVTLPEAILSVFGALFAATLAILNFSNRIADYILQWLTAGIKFSFNNLFSFDWFFINTGHTAFLVYILLCATVTIMFLGKKMSGDYGNFSIGTIIYFFIIYSFLVPIWVSKAVYNTIFSKAEAWR